jgi:hypothetical protein
MYGNRRKSLVDDLLDITIVSSSGSGSINTTLVVFNFLRQSIICLAIRQSKFLIASRSWTLHSLAMRFFEIISNSVCREAVLADGAVKRRVRAQIVEQVRQLPYDVTGLTKGVKVKGQLKFCVTPPISRSSSSSESSPSSVIQYQPKNNPIKSNKVTVPLSKSSVRGGMASLGCSASYIKRFVSI